MARTVVTLTNTFQAIATGRCVVSFSAPGVHSFNDADSDVAARVELFKPSDQVVQNERVTTYAKTLSGDANIIVDAEA